MSRSSRTREPEVYTLFRTASLPSYSDLFLYCGLIRAPRGNQYFTTVGVPEDYQDPKTGDQIRLELRLELSYHTHKRRTWTLTIVGWPSLEREFSHDQLGYDS